MTLPVFAPSKNPSFAPLSRFTPRVDRQTSEKGYDITKPNGLEDDEGISLEWKVLTKNEVDEITSFFRSLNGADGPFEWTPLDNFESPLGRGPEVANLLAGSLAADEYFVTYTWYDATLGETLPSKETAFDKAANNVITVTVPVFPPGVQSWRIYASLATGTETLQDTVTDARLWVMPTTGLVSGAAMPSANTLSGPLVWKRGPLTVSKISAGRFRATVDLKRQFV